MKFYFDKESKSYKEIDSKNLSKDKYKYCLNIRCKNCRKEINFYWNTKKDLKELKENMWICSYCNSEQI